jgi:hypothetical protein
MGYNTFKRKESFMKKIIFVLILSLISSISFAKDGSSGCGPGWYVFNDNSLISSALRATTNGILAITVTIGMTMGTSGCSKHSIVKNEKRNLKFATENYFEIAAEATRGQGQFLSSFGEMLGCKGINNAQFKNEMQKSFNKIFPSLDVNPENLLKETYILILNNESLRNSCFAA